MRRPWWTGLNDVWSTSKTVYLASSDDDDVMDFLGDFIFHRFYATDKYDPRYVKTFLVEAQRWTEWEEWLKKHKADNRTLVPKYVHPLEQIIMSRKGFRILKWVDEYSPFDFHQDPLI